MASRHLSIRIDPESLERLERESSRMQLSRSEAARTLIEEGLRMHAHPGIAFNPGPTGRRAVVMGGPDVWELIGGFPEGDFSDEAVKYVAQSLLLPEWKVRAGLRYYSEFRDEIDDRIRLNDEAAERGYAEWLQAQEAVTNQAH
jgi:hypothetical protein